MSSYSTNRAIALALAFLRIQLKDSAAASPTSKKLGRGKGRSRLSVNDLMITLNNAASRSGNNTFQFNGDTTDALIKGIADLTPIETLSVQAAIQVLIDSIESRVAGLGTHLPNSLEQFADDLPEFMRTRWPESEDGLSALIAGAPLGRLVSTLQGTWRCFYVRPAETVYSLEPPPLQGFTIRFHSADITTMAVEFIGHDRYMSGLAHYLNMHLYIFLRDQKNPNASTLIINAPTDHFQGFSGTGVGLARPRVGQHIPSAVAFMCFGQKWEMCADESDAFDAIITAMKTGAEVQGDQKAFLEEKCRAEYKSLDTLKADHPLLYEYMQDLQINGNQGLLPNSILLKY